MIASRYTVFYETSKVYHTLRHEHHLQGSSVDEYQHFLPRRFATYSREMIDLVFQEQFVHLNHLWHHVLILVIQGVDL